MISRRDFFKLLGIGALSAVVPNGCVERNNEMNIGEIFVKLADGTPLSQEEKQQLYLYGKETQLNNSFVAGLKNGQSPINVSRIVAQDVTFRNNPTSFVVIDKTPDTTIPTGDFTEISNFNYFVPLTGDRTSLTNDYFELSPDDGRIYIKQTNKMYGFYVYTVWEANTVGNRAARIYQYNSDGTQIAFSVVYRYSATPSSSLSSSNIIFVPWGGDRGIGDYVKLAVYQNSGADLKITQCAIGAFVV